MSAEMDTSSNVQDGDRDDLVNGNVALEEEADVLGELSSDISSRPIHKAKRLLGRRSPGKEIGPEGAARQKAKAISQSLTKNSKKSRDGRGRGLPKKGKARGHVCYCKYVDSHDLDPN